MVASQVASTATLLLQHAGHADIVQELIDGRAGPDQDTIDEDAWREYVAQVQAAADTFR
jgi:hypothetical protein